MRVLQGVEVLLRVRREVLLDRRKLRRELAIERKDQRLQDARSATVSVGEGMDRDEMQVRHRCADHGRGIGVSLAQRRDELARELAGRIGFGGLVDGAPVRAGDEHRPRTHTAGPRFSVWPSDIEVQIRDDPPVPFEPLSAC